MIAQRDFQKVDALSIIVMGSDGHAYVLKRRRGSTHVTLAEMAKWAKKRVWWTEDVPTRIESLVSSLNEAYERYIACKSDDLELSADQWLNTADALAGRLTEFIDRGYEVPKVVTLYFEKPIASTMRKRG